VGRVSGGRAACGEDGWHEEKPGGTRRNRAGGIQGGRAGGSPRRLSPEGGGRAGGGRRRSS
jgi:hypothetical protein